MSWKIWEAYRLKKGVPLDEFLERTRIKAWKNLRKMIGRRCAELKDAVLNSSDEQKMSWAEKLNTTVDKLPEITPFALESELLRQFKDDLAHPHKTHWSLETYLMLYTHKGRWYIIPRTNLKDTSDCLKFLRDDPDLEDYHYQNQADPPKDVPTRKYNARGKLWRELDEPSKPLAYGTRFYNGLKFILLDPDNFLTVAPNFERMVKGFKESRKKENK